MQVIGVTRCGSGHIRVLLVGSGHIRAFSVGSGQIREFSVGSRSGFPKGSDSNSVLTNEPDQIRSDPKSHQENLATNFFQSFFFDKIEREKLDGAIFSCRIRTNFFSSSRGSSSVFPWQADPDPVKLKTGPQHYMNIEIKWLVFVPFLTRWKCPNLTAMRKPLHITIPNFNSDM